jgi:zinc protease
MRKTSLAALAGALLLSCGTETPKFAFKTGGEHRGVIGKNGLRFVIMPDTTTKLVEVDVRYDVGAREDPQGKAGLAHLVEHLMFQTRPDGPQTAPLFQTIIAIATNFNAFTSWDQTHYFMTSQAENLDKLLQIEFMRMYYAADLPAQNGIPAFGCSTVPTPEFEREREVVRNEIRAGSSAENYVEQLVEASIYPKGHAYERMVGGNDQQIASAQLSDACAFMKKYYAPERATVLIAGNVDYDQAVKSIEKWFGAIPKREPAPRQEVKPFVPEHQRKEIEADIDRPVLYIGWALPPGNTPEGEAARFGIFNAFFRLASQAEKYDFAYKVFPDFFGGELAPVYLIRIELKGLDRVDEALDFAEKAAKQAYRGWDMISTQDLEEDKLRSKARFIEQLQELPSRTIQVASLVQFSKDVDFNSQDQYLFHELDKIDKFDGMKVAAAVKKSIAWDKAAIVLVKPNPNGIKGDTRAKVKFKPNSDAAMTDPEVDPREAKRPIRMTAELKELASAQHSKLANGMELVILPVHSMPLATAWLVFKNAGQASTPNSPELATQAAEFLRRVDDINFTEMEGGQNTDAYARTGVDARCRATLDAMVCTSSGINIYLHVMIKGLERFIKAGVYDQPRIEKWAKRMHEEFKLPSTQDETEYERQVFTALYGPDHPYTRTAVDTPDAADKVHLDALNAFKNAHFTAGNATLIVVGDFDPKYAEKLAKDAFGEWGTGTVDKPVDATPYKRTGPAFVGVKKHKEDQQVTATIAYPAPAGVDGQEGAREVLTEMLNIRAENVRFKLGSTYGLYFGRQPHKGPSAYMLRGGAAVGGTIDAERAGESIKALRENLDALRAGDHFDEDFVRARRRILSSLLGTSTVTHELAFRLGLISIFGLNPNHYNTLIQQIAAASPAQVKALIKSELDPNNEVVVVLGDKAHLDKTFADAGLKDVKIVEPEYTK